MELSSKPFISECLIYNLSPFIWSEGWYLFMSLECFHWENWLFKAKIRKLFPDCCSQGLHLIWLHSFRITRMVKTIRKEEILRSDWFNLTLVRQKVGWWFIFIWFIFRIGALFTCAWLGSVTVLHPVLVARSRSCYSTCPTSCWHYSSRYTPSEINKIQFSNFTSIHFSCNSTLLLFLNCLLWYKESQAVSAILG